MVRELIKDLENIKGAVVNNYKTFPVAYGEKKTKRFITFLITLTFIPTIILFSYNGIAYMKYYFYFACAILIFIGFYLFKANSRKQYQLLHNILKVLLLIGVFSLLLIDKSLLLDKIISQFN